MDTIYKNYIKYLEAIIEKGHGELLLEHGQFFKHLFACRTLTLSESLEGLRISYARKNGQRNSLLIEGDWEDWEWIESELLSEFFYVFPNVIKLTYETDFVSETDLKWLGDFKPPQLAVLESPSLFGISPDITDGLLYIYTGGNPHNSLEFYLTSTGKEDPIIGDEPEIAHEYNFGAIMLPYIRGSVLYRRLLLRILEYRFPGTPIDIPDRLEQL